MNQKKRGLRLLCGTFLLYLAVEFARHVWIMIPLMIGGVLLIAGYVRQMKEEGD